MSNLTYGHFGPTAASMNPRRPLFTYPRPTTSMLTYGLYVDLRPIWPNDHYGILVYIIVNVYMFIFKYIINHDFADLTKLLFFIIYHVNIKRDFSDLTKL